MGSIVNIVPFTGPGSYAVAKIDTDQIRQSLSMVFFLERQIKECRVPEAQREAILKALAAIQDSDTYCGHCKKINDLFDDVGAWHGKYPGPLNLSGPTCYSCMDKIGWPNGER